MLLDNALFPATRKKFRRQHNRMLDSMASLMAKGGMGEDLLPRLARSPAPVAPTPAPAVEAGPTPQEPADIAPAPAAPAEDPARAAALGLPGTDELFGASAPVRAPAAATAAAGGEPAGAEDPAHDADCGLPEDSSKVLAPASAAGNAPGPAVPTAKATALAGIMPADGSVAGKAAASDATTLPTPDSASSEAALSDASATTLPAPDSVTEEAAVAHTPSSPPLISAQAAGSGSVQGAAEHLLLPELRQGVDPASTPSKPSSAVAGCGLSPPPSPPAAKILAAQAVAAAPPPAPTPDSTSSSTLTDSSSVLPRSDTSLSSLTLSSNGSDADGDGDNEAEEQQQVVDADGDAQKATSDDSAAHDYPAASSPAAAVTEPAPGTGAGHALLALLAPLPTATKALTKAADMCAAPKAAAAAAQEQLAVGDSCPHKPSVALAGYGSSSLPSGPAAKAQCTAAATPASPSPTSDPTSLDTLTTSLAMPPQAHSGTTTSPASPESELRRTISATDSGPTYLALPPATSDPPQADPASPQGPRLRALSDPGDPRTGSRAALSGAGTGYKAAHIEVNPSFSSLASPQPVSTGPGDISSLVVNAPLSTSRLFSAARAAGSNAGGGEVKEGPAWRGLLLATHLTGLDSRIRAAGAAGYFRLTCLPFPSTPHFSQHLSASGTKASFAAAATAMTPAPAHDGPMLHVAGAWQMLPSAPAHHPAILAAFLWVPPTATAGVRGLTDVVCFSIAAILPYTSVTNLHGSGSGTGDTPVVEGPDMQCVQPAGQQWVVAQRGASLVGGSAPQRHYMLSSTSCDDTLSVGWSPVHLLLDPSASTLMCLATLSMRAPEIFPGLATARNLHQRAWLGTTAPSRPGLSWLLRCAAAEAAPPLTSQPAQSSGLGQAGAAQLWCQASVLVQGEGAAAPPVMSQPRSLLNSLPSPAQQGPGGSSSSSGWGSLVPSSCSVMLLAGGHLPSSSQACSSPSLLLFTPIYPQADARLTREAGGRGSTPVSAAPVTCPVDSLPRLPSTANGSVQQQGSGAAGMAGHMLRWSWLAVKAAARALLGRLGLAARRMVGPAMREVVRQARCIGPAMLQA